jgi:hypothetical protein
VRWFSWPWDIPPLCTLVEALDRSQEKAPVARRILDDLIAR